MSLFDRIQEASGARREPGWIPMPLLRERGAGETVDPDRFEEGYDGRKGPKFKALKKGRVTLDPEERALIMKRKAVWHHGPGGAQTPAVWKSVVNGKTWYVTNTHRAMNVTPTLKGTIKQFFDFIKGTA